MREGLERRRQANLKAIRERLLARSAASIAAPPAHDTTTVKQKHRPPSNATFDCPGFRVGCVAGPSNMTAREEDMTAMGGNSQSTLAGLVEALKVARPVATDPLVLRTWGELLRDRRVVLDPSKPRRSWLCGADPAQHLLKVPDGKRAVQAVYNAYQLIAPTCKLATVHARAAVAMNERVTKHWTCNKLPDDTSPWSASPTLSAADVAVG
eukprot:2058561-Prymnesium_polylepis.1